eukprot:773129-Rhodomonas_salina.1
MARRPTKSGAERLVLSEDVVLRQVSLQTEVTRKLPEDCREDDVGPGTHSPISHAILPTS